MISHNLFIAAGHCFDPKPNDGFLWDWPVVNQTGALISSNQAALDMHVDFNYQENSTDTRPFFNSNLLYPLDT